LKIKKFKELLGFGSFILRNFKELHTRFPGQRNPKRGGGFFEKHLLA
jgi:hypothetical protein